MFLLSGLVAVAWMASGINGYSATFSLSLQADVPATDIITSVTSGAISGYVWKNDSTANPVRRDVGQSFYTADDLQLEAFGIRLAGNVQSGDAGGAITLNIYQSTTIGSIGSILTTQTGVFPTLSGGVNQWLNFDVTDYALQGGYYYTLMLTWDAQAPTRNLVFASTPNAYSGGNIWSSLDGVTMTAQSTDYYFYVQGVVPEPNTMVYLSMAGLVFLVGSRLRKRIA